MSTFNKVRAESSLIYEKKGIITHFLLDKDKFIEHGLMDTVQKALDIWNTIGDFVLNVLNWLNDIPMHIMSASITLLSFCYKLLATLILQTPTLIFANDTFKESMSTFTLISIGLFTLFTLITRIKGTVSIGKVTPFKDIVKRYFLVVAGIGFAPFLFEKGFTILNNVSKAITSLGYHEISESDFMLHHDNTDKTTLNWLNVVALLGFDIVLIATLIPIILQNGRRWFDLIMLGTLTPLALSSWVFNEHRHYFRSWWNSIKKIAMTQIVYATFLAVMGIFIFVTRDSSGVWNLIIKLATIAGGLYRMANPPSFILRLTDTNVADTSTFTKSMKDIYSLNIIKKLTPVGKVTSTIKSAKNLFKK